MDNINISAFQNICRTCLSTSDLILINDTDIIDVLQSLSDIKYSKGDELPQKLCANCIKFLDEIQSFVFKCQQTHLTLIKCLTDFKHNQNELLENETINIVNVEDIFNKTKIINNTNNLETEQLATEEIFGKMIKQEEFIDEDISLNIQKTYNSTMTTDNIEENDEEDATDQHNLEFTTEYLEEDELLYKQNVANIKKENILLENISINADDMDEHVNEPEIISIKEEEEEEELATEHFMAEKLEFHQMYLKEEIKTEEIEIPNPIEINTNSLEIISEQHEDNSELLVNIEETQDTDKESNQCNICNKILKTKRILMRHKKIHINESRFKCDICMKVFKLSKNLIAHKKIDCSKSTYQCEVCNKKFTYKSDLMKHVVKHSEERRFECTVCLKRFKKLDSLNQHKRLHSDEQPYQCEVCNKGFIYLSTLAAHQATHSDERPFECDFCTETFKLVNDLNKHKRLHTGEGLHRCEICPKAFTCNSDLVRHRVAHTDERPFECDFCMETFKLLSDLRKHRRIHTGERLHQCEICHKTFTCRNRLVAHEVTHSDERPFACDFCTKTYKLVRDLKRHRKSHTGKLLHECDICNKAFSCKSYLRKHKRTQHAD